MLHHVRQNKEFIYKMLMFISPIRRCTAYKTKDLIEKVCRCCRCHFIEQNTLREHKVSRELSLLCLSEPLESRCNLHDMAECISKPIPHIC